MKRGLVVLLLVALFQTALATPSRTAERPVIAVGSKTFTESYILAEIVAQVIEKTGEAKVSRKYGLGGTGIVYQALKDGAVAVYPEYTGTIAQAILNHPGAGTSEMRKGLARDGIVMSDPLGFNNTYALAVRADFAKRYRLSSISDLAKVPGIRVGFSHEFMNRSDGYPGLAARYGLRFSSVTPMAHSLAYEALGRGQIDLTDIYSTDAKIQKLGLVILRDDRGFFPGYFAVLLARRDFVSRFPKTWAALQALGGRIAANRMVQLNAMADLDKASFRDIAASFLRGAPGLEKRSASWFSWAGFWLLTRQHVYLVSVSLLFSILIGLPLGIVAALYPLLGQAILTVSGLLQTIPSLALLCFLIPFFGIGTVPALVALFLYGLLPIVTGVHTGITGIDPRLTESARALGLSYWQRLRLVDLPLASRSVMAGIKTSAIIGIGTATLAALIGAGGYGQPIVTGLALNDIGTILSGAVPAAGLALLTHFVFEGLNRLLIPQGLRR